MDNMRPVRLRKGRLGLRVTVEYTYKVRKVHVHPSGKYVFLYPISELLRSVRKPAGA